MMLQIVAAALLAALQSAHAASRQIMLSQLPTPALLVDIDELRSESIAGTAAEALTDGVSAEALADALFIHTRVAQLGEGTFSERRKPLAVVDCVIPRSGAYLATGLNNRASYDASYFWARTLGSGARRPAPGIGVDADGGLRWIDDDEAAARGLAPQTGVARGVTSSTRFVSGSLARRASHAGPRLDARRGIASDVGRQVQRVGRLPRRRRRAGPRAARRARGLGAL